MLTLERRQWALVVALVAVSVAVGVVIVTAGFNVSPPPQSAAFGGGTHLLGSAGAAPPDLIEDASATFPVADVVEISSTAPPGSASPIEVRAFDPNGENTRVTIQLVEGRFPESMNEVAVTRRQLDRLAVAIGERTVLGSSEFTVTGIVENPTDLSDEFVFARRGRFEPEETRLLITSTDAQVDAFSDNRADVWQNRESDDSRVATTVALTMATAFVLLEVGLLVVSVVTMLAQRRLRQLGLLAAVGAKQRQIRSAVVAGGVVAGLLASVGGVVLGVAASRVLVPGLDSLANRRIEQVDWPWPVIAILGVMALAATVGAAWWPARTMTRATVAGALRAARPRSARPLVMTAVGLVLLVLGVVGLVSIFSLEDRNRPIFLDVASFLAIPIGAVSLAPAAVRGWAARGPTRGLPARLAQRDLGRYQSRSAATAAALIVVLTIPVMAGTGFRILERSPGTVPSMPSTHLRITPEPARVGAAAAADQSEFTEGVQRLVPEATVVQLEQPMFVTDGGTDGPVIVTPGPFGGGEDVQSTGFSEPLVFGVVTERSGRDFGIETVPTYVGTPDLMEALDLAGFGGADVVTNREGEHGIVDLAGGDVALDQSMTVVVSEFERYTSTPGAVLDPGYVESLGLPIETVGWLVLAEQPFVDSDIARITSAAARLGLLVESRTEPDTGTTLVAAITAGAGLLALGIVAVVGALHRAETADAHMAYEAVGATAAFRRRVHGWTMGTLTLIAALLAVVAGVLSQVGFAIEILGAGGVWESVPSLVVLVVVVVGPLLSYAFGWWTAGTARTRPGPLVARP